MKVTTYFIEGLNWSKIKILKSRLKGYSTFFSPSKLDSDFYFGHHAKRLLLLFFHFIFHVH